MEEKDYYNMNLKHYADKPNVIIHESRHMDKPLYLVHQFNLDPEDKSIIKSGSVYLLFNMTDRCHTPDRAVIEYRLVLRPKDEKYIELITLKLDEPFRGFGLGKIILRYFENKIVKNYYPEVPVIKGYILLGDRNLKLFLQKQGYAVRDNEFIKLLTKPQKKEEKESLLLKYINTLLRQ